MPYESVLKVAVHNPTVTMSAFPASLSTLHREWM